MAITELLAPGTGAATSSEVVVAGGSNITVVLSGADGDNAVGRAKIAIQIKGPNNKFYDVGELSGTGPRSTVIAADGTYRFARTAGPACGVFQAA